MAASAPTATSQYRPSRGPLHSVSRSSWGIWWAYRNAATLGSVHQSHSWMPATTCRSSSLPLLESSLTRSGGSEEVEAVVDGGFSGIRPRSVLNI